MEKIAKPTGHDDQPRRCPSCLARARFLAGFTQADLARAAGVSRTTISDLENGKRVPLLQTLEAVSAALGLDDVRSLFPDRPTS